MTNKELIIGFFMEGYVHHNYDFLMDHMAADYFDNSPCAARTNLECVNILNFPRYAGGYLGSDRRKG